MQNPITLEEQRKVWTIHQSVNGITYYYNRSTKKSQYEMPECFKITEEDLDHPDWKEYRTAEGRKFYYNALTRKSCWHMPSQVKEWKMKMQQQKRLEKEKNGEDGADQKLSEADELKKKFISLLKNKPITINTKWDACIKICEDDDRWNLLRMSDKKKYFNDFIAELKKINDIEKKAKVEINRTHFLKMLRQSKKLTSDCKMHRVQFDFITDPRWRMLEGVDRENAFQDYMDTLLHKQKQEKKVSKDRNIENLKILLEEQEVKSNTKWDEFRSLFRNNQCYKNLHPLDRINTFTDYIIETQKKVEEAEQKQKMIKEKMNRVNLRNFIKEKIIKGDINYKTQWKQFCKEYRQENVVLNMFDPQQHGTTAQEIFQVIMYGVRESHKTFKNEIKQHFKNKNFKMHEETLFHEFKEKLSDLPLYADARPFLQEYFYHYFKQKIKSKHNAKIEKQKEKERQKLQAIRKTQKKQKKIIFKIFKQICQETKTKYNISEHIPFIENSLKEHHISISSEGIFKYFLAYLENGSNQKDRKSDKSSSSERSADKNKKKKKKKEKNYHREEEKQKSASVVPKSITIPAELKHDQNVDMDIEEEGEIKDEESPAKAKIAQKVRNYKTPSESSKSKSKEKKKKKHKKKKSKNKGSSSDSD